MKRACVAIVLASTTLFPAIARADAKAECIAASEQAQSLRDDRKLLESRQQFLTCARDVCPAAVRKDCADQMAEVVKRIPSVVLHAKDESGQDLVAVKVSIDGRTIAETLDGRSISLDPGVHTFRFEAAGKTKVDQQVVLAESERDRPVTARLGGGDTARSTGSGKTPEAPPPLKKTSAPVAALVVGGIGLAAMGVAPVLYVMGLSQKSTDEGPTGCKNTGGCSQSEIDSIHTKLLVEDIVMLAGGAIFATGLIWTIVHYASGHSEAAAPSAAAFSVAPTTGGAMATTTIRF